MPISVKGATGYKLVYDVWQKVDDVWVPIPTIHYKIGGAWKKVHSKLTPFVFNKTISVNTYGYVLREDALIAGWDGVQPLLATVTISAGIIVGAGANQNFGFSTGLIFPQGCKLTLINHGTIAGMGGKGGDSGKLGNLVAGKNGYRGGTAVFIAIPTVLYNYGSILAGGGGGGAGGVIAAQDFSWMYRGGAGGGGRGANVSLPGVTEMTNNNRADHSINSMPATGGSLESGGIGGVAEGAKVLINTGGGPTLLFDYSGRGGNGGLLASSGANGTMGVTYAGNPVGSRRYWTFGLGAPAGKAISGKSWVTYKVTGTITGVQE